MYSTLITLLNRLDKSDMSATNVISWGSPVPSFGDLSSSQVATVGINPSNREFVDELGNELEGVSRRFHTLNSLGLETWSDVDARHIRMILDSCRTYFLGNPYNQWFRRLEQVISGLHASFYGSSRGACHLDLIPFATRCKWYELAEQQRSLLLDVAGDTLALLLMNSPVQIVVLNGMSVVQQFQNISGIRLERKEMPQWSLPRRGLSGVMGLAFHGVVNEICGIALGHNVLVLGYNHNLQSSYGVTNEVVHSISKWIAKSSQELHQ